MFKKLLLSLVIVVLCIAVAFPQSGTIKGKVVDHTGEPLSFTYVYLKKEDKAVNYALTGADGAYQIFGIATGTYDVEVDATLTVCKKKVTMQGVQVSDGKTVFLDLKVPCATDLEEFVFVYERPVFDQDNTKSEQTISGDDVRKTPGRSLSAALANMAGVASVDGSISSVRGNRADGQQTIVDGVKIRSGGVAMSSIEEMTLIQGGIPAEYGDGTSFTVITTKGASKDFNGSVELMGSLDGYNNFLAAANVTGPILKGKTKKDPTRIGFLVSAEASYDKDGAPARGGTWRATDETIDRLVKTPVRYVEGGSYFPAISQNADYITKADLKKQRVRDNASAWGYLLQGKLDFVPKKDGTLTISVGGSYDYSKGHNWGGIYYALFNAQNNSMSKASTARVNARINHRAYTDTASNAILKNIMYNINNNYSYYNAWTRDRHHGQNYFNYGHIGKFTTKQAESYDRQNITILDADSNAMVYEDMWVMTDIGYDSLVLFDGSNSCNPELAYYTQNFVDNYSPDDVLNSIGYNYNKTAYQMYSALLNGDLPSSSYGLFQLPGVPYNGVSKSEYSQLGAKLSLSMNLGDHELKLGYEFEKYTSRGFSISPVSLWTMMRQSANAHIKELDVENPIFVGSDTIRYNRFVNYEAQTTFDKNLRAALNKGADEWIDVDSYDPETFDLSMFSAEELLVGTGGGSLISYYGYDYTGKNKYKGKTSIKDFFTAADENGNKLYNIGAYQPVYMSLWVQDKFSIKNLLFNVGVRIDRFDANQSVLSDPYLFRGAQTAGEVRDAFKAEGITMPSNVKDDWIVYVNQKDGVLDASNTNIIGYRNGNTWYDLNGQEISDPETMLGANGGPILKTPLERGALSKVHYEAFEDYQPQWSVMPRLSFSFPVSTNSLFSAHYSIITNRPTNLQLSPISYLFIEKFGTSSIVSNPNLKPQKSIEYEVCFRQKIGEKSALSLLAYYSEKRDQIQSYRYSGAYPNTYYSYANLDFGTVQGFTLSYELRRTHNISLRASYTLQFAKGTGSSATSGLAIIQSGQPNLRTLTNLSFDQRHALSLWIDYHFDGGLDYNGPTTTRVRVKNGVEESSDIKWFQNAGISLNISARSGTPYSRSSKAFSDYVTGTKSQLSGTINGSNMPWIFQCDLRIDKSFTFNLNGKNAKDKEGNPKGKKPGYLTVYLDILNLFNIKNVIYVYEYTGNADDDGYLSAAEYQQQILSQISTDSFYDLYSIRMQDPYNYSQPIRARLGLQFSF